jgi:Tfp pilus assembly protein PilW
MSQSIKIPFRMRAVLSSLGTMQLTLLFFLSFACVEQKHTATAQSPTQVPVSESKAAKAGEQEGPCNPGEILVRFRDGTDEQAIARIQKEVELKTIRLVSSPELYLMQVVGELSEEETVQRLRKYREVIFAEPNYVRQIK